MALDFKCGYSFFYQIRKSFGLKLLAVALSFTGIVFCPRAAPAQEETTDSKSHIVLEDVSVTATRTEQEVADVPASVTIINQEEIEASPFQTIYDLLRMSAGIDVGEPYVAEAFFNNVNVRGTGGYGDRTLILVDGIPQNNANNGWVEWSQIPKEAIERVEIVRGSSSAQYGTNAMGGVINLITKKPGKKRKTSVEGSYGSAGTYSAEITHEQRVGNLGVYLNGLYENSDGYVLKKPAASYDIDQYRRVGSIYAKAIYDFSEDTNATLGYSGLDKKLGYGREYFYGYAYNNRYWADFSHKGGKVNWKAKLFLNHDKWEWNYDKAPNYDYLNMYEKIPMTAMGGSLQSTIKLAGWNDLILGVDFKQNKLDKQDTYYTVVRDSGTKGKQTALSAFFGDHMRLAQGRLILDFGGRYDWIKAYDGRGWDTNPSPKNPYSNVYPEKTWGEFTPKFGATYHITDATSLKGTIGMGFNAPSLYQLYSSLLRGPYLIKANPELEPETILSYDLSVEHAFLDDIRSRLTLYQSHAKDFIGYEYPSAFIWRRQNISKVRIHGVEMELGWWINSQWDVFLNYTYNRSEIRENASDPEVEGNDLPQTPHHKVSAGVTYTNPDIVNFNVLFHYVSKMYETNDNVDVIDGHATVDLCLWRKIFEFLTAKLEVENLFNNKYVTGISTNYDTIVPGLVVRGYLRFEF
ncbi:MAG: TonB-dependent receptor [Deltaproteobacteria bacterium]|nr:TonB-dependent receptor [Deltaproteobacteria bacterium]